MGAWNPIEAKEDFHRVCELDTSLEMTCRKELKKLEDLEKIKDEQDKAKLKNLF